ncbi:hypothetical protein C8R34_1488 [Nitrosomonas sp. Nm84]|nr:hypothetical protein C8R34_1488 [Nitrosomonas sp. Nm84]
MRAGSPFYFNFIIAFIVANWKELIHLDQKLNNVTLAHSGVSSLIGNN